LDRAGSDDQLFRSTPTPALTSIRLCKFCWCASHRELACVWSNAACNGKQSPPSLPAACNAQGWNAPINV